MAVAFYFIWLTIICLLNRMTLRRYEDFFYWFSAVVVIYMATFVSMDYTDWLGYTQTYEAQTSLVYTKDIGFGLLCYLMKYLSLPASSLRLIIFIALFSIMFATLNKFGANKVLFLLLYSMYPLTSDTIQLRNTIALAISIYAISCLICDHRPIKYIILIILAATFHKIVILYLPFVLFSRTDDKSQGVKAILSISAILVAFAGWRPATFSQISNILLSLSSNVNLGNYTNYLGASLRFGWIIDWAIVGANVFLSWRVYSNVRKDDAPEERLNELANGMLLLNVYSVLFLPLLLVSFDYFRIVRNLLPLNYMLYLVYAQYRPKGLKQSYLVSPSTWIVLSIAYCAALNYVKLWYRGPIVELEFLDFFVSALSG